MGYLRNIWELFFKLQFLQNFRVKTYIGECLVLPRASLATALTIFQFVGFLVVQCRFPNYLQAKCFFCKGSSFFCMFQGFATGLKVIVYCLRFSSFNS